MPKQLPYLCDPVMYLSRGHQLLASNLKQKLEDGKVDDEIASGELPEIYFTLTVLYTLVLGACSTLEFLLANSNKWKIANIQRRLSLRQEYETMLVGGAGMLDLIYSQNAPGVQQLLRHDIDVLIYEEKAMPFTPDARLPASELQTRKIERALLQFFFDMIEYKLNPLVQNV